MWVLLYIRVPFRIPFIQVTNYFVDLEMDRNLEKYQVKFKHCSWRTVTRAAKTDIDCTVAATATAAPTVIATATTSTTTTAAATTTPTTTAPTSTSS